MLAFKCLEEYALYFINGAAWSQLADMVGGELSKATERVFEEDGFKKSVIWG